MTFLSPWAFLALLIPIALLGAQLLVEQKRKALALRFSSAEMLSNIAPKVPWYKRNLPRFVLYLAFIPLIFAWARPVTEREVATERALVVLAMDISLSMNADDVAPTRFDAAREAANDFVSGLPNNIDVALISFAANAALDVPPTENVNDVTRALDRLELSEATAVGEAIALSVRTALNTEGPEGPLPARVIVLSDGETTAGMSEEDAIALANQAEIPISTISFGTPNGQVIIEDPFNPFAGPQLTPVPVAEDNLRAIANSTGGEFFTADSVDELSSVYEDIGVGVDVEIETVELGYIFVGIALGLFTLAAVGSLLWMRRLP